MLGRTSRLAAVIVTAALSVAAFGAGSSLARPLFDPGMNFAIVYVDMGGIKEDVKFKMPVGVLDASKIKLIGVDAPSGITVNLKEYKIVDTDKLELKVDVKHEFLKGTAAGAYPVALTLEDADGALCTIFVTVMVQ